MAENVQVILLVDDELTPLTIRKILLQKAGFTILTANSGHEALDIIQRTEIALVVSDHLMPEMTGAQLVARVKQLRPDLPFMLLSGVNDLPPGAELADLFLSKLEGPERMTEAVRSLLEK